MEYFQKTIPVDELIELINKHGSTTKIFVAIQGTGTAAMCGVAPKYAIEMCKNIKDWSGEYPENISCDIEFHEFEMLNIHAIDA